MSQVGHTFVTVRRPLRAYIGSLPHRPPETRPGRPEPPGSRRENPPGKPAGKKRRRGTRPPKPLPANPPRKPTPGNPPAGTDPGEPTPENLPPGAYPGEPTGGNHPARVHRREPIGGNRSPGTPRRGNRPATRPPRAHGEGVVRSLSVPGRNRAEINLKSPTYSGRGVSNRQVAEKCKKSFGGHLAKVTLKNPKGRRNF